MLTRGWRWSRRLLDHEYSAAVTLMAGVVTALTWSALNAHAYFSFTAGAVTSSWARRLDATSLHSLAVNGLMAIFFYALGLELRREIDHGALANRRDALAPLAGALGGMAATAGGSLLLGAMFNSDALWRGWGVPMATDVAFTLGALALVGRRLPSSLRLFVLALAVADDVLSVIVLLFTGATDLHETWLIGASVAVVVAWWLGRRRLSVAVNVTVLLVLWLCFVQANLEPALAGVVAGSLVRPRSPTHPRLERGATRIASLVVLPLFGFVATGVHWSNLGLNHGGRVVILSTIVIRLVGKTLGIAGGVWIATRVGARGPRDVTTLMLFATAALCAMGFTVPLLFAGTLFSPNGPIYGAFSLGLLLATVIAGLVGGSALRGLTMSKLKEQ
ncbi:MAG: Na+/H+ antiporter NhaA [Acidobacteriota bacterium]|nr:Na+/H+ antiporter NhaA [Acidobacteriota bacterium]